MPVPSWAAIPDADVDLESPITESLMQRLRNQWAAFMGVDPTSVTQPAFSLPASTQNVEDEYLSYGYTAGGTSTAGSEVRVSVVTDDVEDVQIGAPPSAGGPREGQGEHIGAHCTIHDPLIDDSWLVMLHSINVQYSAGSPTAVQVRGGTTHMNPVYNTTTTLSVDLALTDTWTNLFSNSTGSLQAKARATSTDVYIQFRCTSGNAAFNTHMYIPIVRKSFKSKN